MNRLTCSSFLRNCTLSAFAMESSKQVSSIGSSPSNCAACRSNSLCPSCKGLKEPDKTSLAFDTFLVALSPKNSHMCTGTCSSPPSTELRPARRPSSSERRSPASFSDVSILTASSPSFSPANTHKHHYTFEVAKFHFSLPHQPSPKRKGCSPRGRPKARHIEERTTRLETCSHKSGALTR